MSDTRALLRAVLSKLNRGDAPDSKYPDRRGEYWALCPFCDDHHASNFSVSERGFKCFACGASGGLLRLAQHLGVAVPQAASAGPRQPEASGGVTLADYASAKRLDPALLAEWGVTQHDNGRGPYLAIPYRDASGRVVAERRRYTLRKGKRDNRFAWRSGDTPALYGLWRLSDIRAQGWVLLVEGESDCHTAWSYDLPALGVPGAQAWRPEWAEHLRGLQVFAWQEPDRGGEAFVRSIAANVPDLRVLRPPEGVKDLSDAHLLGHDVRALVAQLKASAAAAQAAADGDAGQVQVLQRFYPRPYSELLLQRYRFLATSTTSRGDFYVYDTKAGIWRSNAEDLVAAYVRRARIMNDEQKKRYAIEEIVADVRGLTWSPDGLPTPDVHLLPFSNGVYDLRTATLRPYTPDDGFTWQLPWRYNPDAHSSFISRHLVNFPDEIQVHFWELLAYCLWRGYPYQRFFLWFGKRGGNGKTFLTNTMRYTLGVQHVAGLTLNDIQTNRFAAAALYGKLANIAGEVAYSDLENTDLLKKLVGDDWLQCERKYHDPVPFKNHAKLIFLTNSVPVTRDTSDAFYRRAFLVQFEQQFDENPEILNQLSQLAASPAGIPEFEWVLANAVATLHDLLARHFVMTGHRSAEETRRVYEQLSNPLRRFLNERCVQTYQDDFIYKQDFQERFNAWLAEQGLTVYTPTRLGTSMKALGIQDGKRGEARMWAWIGLRWAE